jgi:hypothetical protein
MVVVNSQSLGGVYVPGFHQLGAQAEFEFLTNVWSAITGSKIMLDYNLLTARAVITLSERCLNLKDIQRRGRTATGVHMLNPYSWRRDTEAITQYKHSESKNTNHGDQFQRTLASRTRTRRGRHGGIYLSNRQRLGYFASCVTLYLVIRYRS